MNSVTGTMAPRPALNSVSLLCVDTRTPDLALRAMRRCMAMFDFGEAVLVSTDAAATLLTPEDPIRLAVIPELRSIADYSHLMLHDTGRFTNCAHVLVVQWDGFIVRPELWRDEFLTCDYIGAPWIHEGAEGLVGNGGFSLRSRRLIDALLTLDIDASPTEPEDVSIGITHRAALEALGMRFAPESLARVFSYECGEPRPTLGFHGLFNFGAQLTGPEVRSWLTQMPARMLAGNEGRNLIKNLMRQGDAANARLALDKRVAAAGWSRDALMLALRIGWHGLRAPRR